MFLLSGSGSKWCDEGEIGVIMSYVQESGRGAGTGTLQGRRKATGGAPGVLPFSVSFIRSCRILRRPAP